MIGIADELDAYSLDTSLANWGMAVQNAIENVEEKKQQRELDKWLGIPPKYRNPIASS